MKIVPNKFFVLIVFLFGAVNNYVLAAGPPPPTPPPPPLPINQGIIILFIIGLLFGIYTIYKHKSNEKTPV